MPLQCPRITSSTFSASRPVRSSRPLSAVTPRSTAVRLLNIPPYRPIGVRTGSQMTTSRMVDLSQNLGWKSVGENSSHMKRPPVTSSTVPVMYDDMSEARNRATLATSPTSPARCMGGISDIF